MSFKIEMKQRATNLDPPINRLIAALPDDVYQRLYIHLQPVDLVEHQILSHPGDFYDYAYFPSSSLIW